MQLGLQNRFQTGLEEYSRALQSDNPGLVEDAIFRVTSMYMNLPDLDYSKVTAELYKLALDGKTTAIQKKAGIAYEYINKNDRMITANVKSEYENPQQLFLILNSHLRDAKSIAHNFQKNAE